MRRLRANRQENHHLMAYIAQINDRPLIENIQGCHLLMSRSRISQQNKRRKQGEYSFGWSSVRSRRSCLTTGHEYVRAERVVTLYAGVYPSAITGMVIQCEM